jgi:hypothetical protein
VSGHSVLSTDALKPDTQEAASRGVQPQQQQQQLLLPLP